MKQHYIVPKPSYPHYICYPDMLGRYDEYPEHSERREEGYLKEYNLHLVCKGRGYVTSKTGERIELGVGDGFLFAREAFQQYESSKENPWDVRWIHFTVSMPLPMLQAADLYGGWFFSFTNKERLLTLTDRMLELTASFELGNEPQLSALLYELITHIAIYSERLELQAQHHKRNNVRRVADIIRRRCAEDWDLERMAALSGYSSYHFLRTFRETIGVTPNQFLTECRIVTARLLLATTRLTVVDIAERCGFSQASYFIRVFRKSEGLSPLTYRSLHNTREGIRS